jgi:ubiquitin C-terminal hydrolase
LRFGPNETNFAKNDSPIPIEQLEVKLGETRFTVESFVKHIGTTRNSGHYIAYCRTEKGWARFNDSDVTLISQDEALKQAKDGYLFCLKRV